MTDLVRSKERVMFEYISLQGNLNTQMAEEWEFVSFTPNAYPERVASPHQWVFKKEVKQPKAAHTQADIEGHGDDLWPEQTS